MPIKALRFLTRLHVGDSHRRRVVVHSGKAQFDDAFGTHYHEAKGRRGLPTRLMAGLHLLKHMKGLSDEETCAAWLENPYFQAFCGETYFQHRLPFDRSSLTRWRQRIGAGDLEALLAETGETFAALKAKRLAA